MAHMNIADLIIDTLEQIRVERIFGVVGDSLNGLTESIRRRARIEWVHVRHEEAAAFAASGESQITGKLSVCAGSCGPGNLHLINGLFDAHRTRTPVLAIAAQIPSAEIGSGYFQETDPKALFKDCSSYCEMVSDPRQMPYVLENAIRSAVGNRGVSVIIMPGDVALLPAPERGSSLSEGLLPAMPRIVPQSDQIEALATMLNTAERVTLFCGRGCADAHAELMQVAGTLKSPIVHALGGKEYVEYDNPYDVGMTGFIGFSSGYAAMHNCEALLMLGTDFPYKQFLPSNTLIAQVDVRPENLGRRCKLDLGVVGDVKETIAALLPKLKTKTETLHLENSVAHYRSAREGLDDLAKGSPGKKPIHPQYVSRLVSEMADDDAVFTFDVGTPTIWAARYLKMNGRRRLVGSLAHGSMANALPQAIGIQAAQRERQVISMSGDGGFAMLMGDLLTLKQTNLPVKIVVLNNGVLGFVALEMKAAGFVEMGTDLENPDFAAIARAAGLFGRRVEDPGDLPDAISDLFSHDGPGLLDVVSATQELSMPPTIGVEQMKGFSLWLVRAVLSGRGDEVVDLATTNLLPR
jgi:pyruvate dehydrogenase (quinone)